MSISRARINTIIKEEVERVLLKESARWNSWACAEHADFRVVFYPDKTSKEIYAHVMTLSQYGDEHDWELASECKLAYDDDVAETFKRLKKENVINDVSELWDIFETIKEKFNLPTTAGPVVGMGKQKKENYKKFLKLAEDALNGTEPWKNPEYREDGIVSWLKPKTDSTTV